MSNTLIISICITLGGVIISVVSSVFVAGTRWGEVRNEMATLKQQQSHAATKEELQNVKESLAEIKGMFRLTLKE